MYVHVSDPVLWNPADCIHGEITFDVQQETPETLCDRRQEDRKSDRGFTRSRCAVEQEVDFHRVIICQCAQAIVTAGDHGRNREFTAVADPRNFVLEVTGHHITHLAHRIFHL